jgi:hypothetical protein
VVFAPDALIDVGRLVQRVDGQLRRSQLGWHDPILGTTIGLPFASTATKSGWNMRIGGRRRPSSVAW